MSYEPRESINPRTFALRHALLEELKLRQQRVVGDSGQEQFVALARALDVSYDASTRHFVVCGSDGASCVVPLEALRLYETRTDAAAASWQRDDEILRANRALAVRVIDQLSSLPSRGQAP